MKTDGDGEERGRKRKVWIKSTRGRAGQREEECLRGINVAAGAGLGGGVLGVLTETDVQAPGCHH